MAKFEVVALALAPERHIATFIAHYRRRGADRIRVFFDGETALAGDFEGGEVIACDDGFWRDLGVRPDSVENRQRAVYDLAYRSADADWLLVVDVDEFILGEGSIADLLARIEPSRESVIFRTVEAVFDARHDLSQEYGAAFFRKSYGRPLSSILPHLVYPGCGGFFTKGLLGHDMGKHAVRTGLGGIEVDIHESKRDGVPFRAALAKTLHLAHYDAISLEQWRAKWDRRLAVQDTMEMGRKRSLQSTIYGRARRLGAEVELFRRIYVVGGFQTFVLRCLNLIIPNKTNDLTV
ncbi:glycosyltransferase family 2 protein [Brevundimonas sp.]|uniref:glycosyltransferase family 2 protein n=1 Tax=Brevundimonas sp. TaxID=1871086 RepID=UPI0025C52AD5|nr:glycosyltransferase family 2 protein [Brevundimonas sp.]